MRNGGGRGTYLCPLKRPIYDKSRMLQLREMESNIIHEVGDKIRPVIATCEILPSNIGVTYIGVTPSLYHCVNMASTYGRLVKNKVKKCIVKRAR